MGISEREYQEMLRRNNELRVADDGRPSAPAHQPHAAYRLTEVKLHADPAPSEHEEQCALFAWADAAVVALPELMLMFAVPNGEYRPIATAARLKKTGTKAGVPDIFLPAMRRGEDGRTWGGLFIEMKRKPNKPSPEQREWIAALRESGYMCVVAYGADEAIKTITHYLSLEGGHE